MKKTRLLIALLVMLVAASGFAQDSYREAVKDYLKATDQFEKNKSTILTMSMLYESDGQVDVNQLTNRYLDEQYENDMIDKFVDEIKLRNMTEADLKAVASLLSTPEGKIFIAHNQKWAEAISANMISPFMAMYGTLKLKQEKLRAYEDGECDLDDSMGVLELLGPPIQPNADIDAAYAAKFNDVFSGLDAFAGSLMDAITKGITEDTTTHQTEEERVAIKDYMDKSMRALMLNSAYGTLTLEDLDFAAKLNANESYKKLNDFSKFNDLLNNPAELEELKKGNIMVKYSNWMEEHGAKVTEDPEAGLDFFKLLFKQFNLNFEDFFKIDEYK